MINFVKLKIEGFGSIGNLELDLDKKGTTLIRGAIGTGKTTIFSAIVWVLYGKNIKGVSEVKTWDKYQGKKYKGTKVELIFNTEKGIHHVIRCQGYSEKVHGAKGSSRLIYLRNAEEISEKGKNKIQELITSDVGMSYNLFMNSTMFGQGMKRLIQEAGKDQKSIFEEIYEVTWASKARDIAKKYFDELRSEISELETKSREYYDRFQDAKQTYKDLREREQNFLDQQAIQVKALLHKRDLSAIRVKEISNNPPDFPLPSENLVKKYESRLQRAKSKLRQYREGKSRLSVEDIVNETVELILVGEQNGALENLQKIQAIFRGITKYTRHVTKYTKNILGYNTIASKWDEWEESKDSARKKLREIRQEIRALRHKKVESLSDKYHERYKAAKRKYLSLNPIIEKKQKELQDYQWVYSDALGPNGVKAFLFESSMGFINETLESYSEILGFNVQFYMDIYSAKKDFRTLITMEGIEVKYEELSGGQKQLVNLAVAFAMNEVMTSSKGVNIAFLDEIFENLNREAIETVIGLIQRVYQDKTLFLISHHDSLPIHNARVLQVSRKKGLSVYE